LRKGFPSGDGVGSCLNPGLPLKLARAAKPGAQTIVHNDGGATLRPPRERRVAQAA